MFLIASGCRYSLCVRAPLRLFFAFVIPALQPSHQHAMTLIQISSHEAQLEIVLISCIAHAKVPTYQDGNEDLAIHLAVSHGLWMLAMLECSLQDRKLCGFLCVTHKPTWN